MTKLLWILLVGVLGWPVNVWAVGESLYVRPAGGAYGTEDGTSYANAFDGFADVTWGGGAGNVGVGDTLYVCGDHVTELVVGLSGSAGNIITIDGNCPDDPGSIDTHALSGAIEAIDITNFSFLTIQNFGSHDGNGAYTRIGLRGAVRYGIGIFSTGALRSDITIQDNVIDNRTASHGTNTCHAIAFTGSGTFTNGIIRRNLILGTGTNCASQDNNDGINIEDVVGPFLIESNYISGAHEGIDVSSGSNSGMVIRYNVTYNNTSSGLKIHGGTVCPVGLVAYGNLSYGNGVWAFIFEDAQNSVFANNTGWQEGGADPREALAWGLVNVPGTCTFTGNALINNILAADYTNGVINVFTGTIAEFAANTVNGNLYWQLGANTAILYADDDLGNNVTESNFATWQTSHPKDRNELPTLLSLTGLEGGTATLDTRLQFRTTGASTLRRAGTSGFICQDVRNRACYPDRPDIGAYQATSGDPAATRTAR